MGYGLDTARAISEFEDEASVALKVIGGLFVFGFLFDIHFWHPEHFTAKIFTSTLVVVALPALWHCPEAFHIGPSAFLLLQCHRFC